jgi:hypothetical protein
MDNVFVKQPVKMESEKMGDAADFSGLEFSAS